MTDNRVRPPVPPEPSSGFEGVPRDWASAADRRAANAGSRFAGSPSNEAPYVRDVATLRAGAPPTAEEDAGSDVDADRDVDEPVNVDADRDVHMDADVDADRAVGADRDADPQRHVDTEGEVDARSDVDRASHDQSVNVDADRDVDSGRDVDSAVNVDAERHVAIERDVDGVDGLAAHDDQAEAAAKDPVSAAAETTTAEADGALAPARSADAVGAAAEGAEGAADGEAANGLNVVENDETDLADAAQMVDAPAAEDVETRVAPDVDAVTYESTALGGAAYDNRDGAYDYEHDRDEAVDRARVAAEHHGTEVDWFAPAAAAAAGGAGALAPPDEYDYEHAGEYVQRDPEDEPAWNRPSTISPITRGERRAIEAAAVAEAKAGAGLNSGFGQVVFALTRLLLGFVFLWAFLDKLLGLGRGTPKADAWRDGGSPTDAYLSNVGGPAAGFFNDLAGRSWVDWLFMIGLAAIGVALILGIGMTITAIAATAMLGLMYAASLPIASNPFVDDHLIYALVIIGIAATGAGLRFSLAPWWRRTRLVRALPFLR